MGLSYAKVGELFGFAKSTLCKWLKQEPIDTPSIRGRVLEMDGVWTRTSLGRQELKVVRDDQGTVMASFDKWDQVVDEAYNRGVRDPIHLVSDGDRAIAQAIQMVYGSKSAHQLCVFHLLQEYSRNIGYRGWSEAKALLESQDMLTARALAVKIVDLTDGQGRYWCRKALAQGLTHLRTGQSRYKTTSRLERFQREIRRREHMGTLWSQHNLLVLLQKRGLITSTT